MRPILIWLALALFVGCGANIQIRVKNDTGNGLSTVKIGLENYGDVAADQRTDYKSFKEGSFDVTAAGKKLGNLFFQSVGAPDVTPRFFTLFISNGPALSLRDDLNSR